MGFCVMEQLVEYDPVRRLSWQADGTWPHANHFHFHEAVVSAHFILLGYNALRDYGIEKSHKSQTTHATQILHSVVGPVASEFLLSSRFSEATDGRSGLPDLFVFRALAPANDPKVRYKDPADWFFVEVKGPGDRVGENQKKFWHAVAEELGPERIKLFKTTPKGTPCCTGEVEY